MSRRRRLRSIAAPFVVAPPAGARVRTRLHVSGADAVVLAAVGAHLGGLAGADLAWRCSLGDVAAGDRQRAERKRALTASARWAGAITRTSNDQWDRGWHNLADERGGLRRAITAIGRRLAVPVGDRCGRATGTVDGVGQVCPDRPTRGWGRESYRPDRPPMLLL